MGMTEPDVTLTDYLLVVECAAFAWLIARRPARLEALRRWIVAFFLFTALAALSGGTVHGFFSANDGGMGSVLWKLSMLAIGATALAGCAIGARLLFARDGAARVVGIAAVLAGVYAATILFVNDAFWIAVVGYLPAAALLFVAFLTAAVRERASWARRGAWGLAASFVAAAVQQLRIGLHPAYFNHNALYHLVQAVALALVFAACRDLLAPAGGLHADAA
jgi:hypothetical protein